MLKNKNIIITGANGKIGRAACEKLAKCGANIWACIRKSDESAEKFFSETAKKNTVWIKSIYIDLGNEDSMDKGIGKILGDKLPIDVLVNNAGIMKTGLLNLTSIDILKEVFEINLFSQLYIIKKISKRMIRNKKGNIINISSVSGMLNREGLIAYGGSKAALNHATKTLANEYKPFGIRVNAIAPGPIEINNESNYPAEQIEEFKALSYNRRVAAPNDVANLIAFLASDESEHINGQIISVDGGAFC